MNGQTNNNKPIRPDFSGLYASSNNNDSGNPIPPPVPLSDKGIGFSNEPVFSSWSPSMIPVPGPIAESVPQNITPIITSPATMASPSVAPAAPASPIAPAPAVDARAIPPVLPTQTNPVSPAVFAPSPSLAPTPAIPTASSDQTPIIPMAIPYVASINPSPIINTPAVAPQTASFIPPAPMPVSAAPTTPSPMPAPNPAFTPAPSSLAPTAMPTAPMPSPIVPAPISQEVTPQVAPALPVQAPTSAPTTPVPAPAPAPISQEPSPQVVPPLPAPFITQPYIVAPPATQTSFASPSIPPVPQPVSSPRPVVSNLPTESHTPIPASKPTQYEIQTLASDMASLKVSGGADITPQTFIPGGVTGEEVFNLAVAATVKPKSNKKILIIIGAIILLALIVVIGFFFIKLLFLTPAITPDPAAIVTVSDVELPLVELPRKSFFVSPADATREWNIGSVDVVAFRSVFQPSAGETIQDGAMIELNITRNNNPILFSEFLTAMLPDKNIAGIAATFEDDFTLFVYRDGINDLPGFIAKVRATTTPETLAAFSAALEASPNLKNFYVTDPGVMSAFRVGAIQGDPIKYAPFAAGYAFNHGWFKDALGANYLVVSSSHKGMVRAIELARF